MKRRFSIRFLLFVTVLTALGFSVYTYNANTRAKEIKSIEAIVGLSGPGQTIVSEPGVTYQTDGGVIWLQQTGPALGSFYGFDICRRVTMIKLVGDIDPRVFDHLHNFNQLKSVWLEPTYRRDHANRVTELLSTAIEFREQAPNVDVEVLRYDSDGALVRTGA